MPPRTREQNAVTNGTTHTELSETAYSERKRQRADQQRPAPACPCARRAVIGECQFSSASFSL